MKKDIVQSIKVILLAVVLSAGIAMAQTWSGPTGAAPTNNVAAPINAGGTSQVKLGALGTGPLAVFGNSAMYGDVSILGSSTSTTPNTQTGFLKLLGKTAFAQQITTNSNLFVSGQVTVGGLASSAGSHVCVDGAGQLTLCAASPTPGPSPVECNDGSDNDGDGTIDMNDSGCSSPTDNSEATTPPPHGTVVFDSSGSWTVPGGVTSLSLQVWGGGGGGGSSSGANQGAGGGGGGGGGYSTGTVAVTPGQSISFTVGAQAAGGGHDNETSSGESGNLSSILGIIANGGGGGSDGANGFPAPGGGGGGGNNDNGDAGALANGTGNNTGNGGNGGNAGGTTGTGGAGGTASLQNGSGGGAPGGGGGGGNVHNADGRHSGGTGHAGRIIITY